MTDTSTCAKCGKTWEGLPDVRGLCPECERKDNEETR
jgi:NMD protein affecting ribosome stability and mRNA decay